MKGHINSILILQSFTQYEEHLWQGLLLSQYVTKYKNKVNNKSLVLQLVLQASTFIFIYSIIQLFNSPTSTSVFKATPTFQIRIQSLISTSISPQPTASIYNFGLRIQSTRITSNLQLQFTSLTHNSNLILILFNLNLKLYTKKLKLQQQLQFEF